MKKFTKMLALGLAAALVLGMSVQAAPSTTTAATEEKNDGSPSHPSSTRLHC